MPEDNVRYNEVDFDETMENYDQQLRDEVQVESVVIIVLCSLLVTVLFFGKYTLFENYSKVFEFWRFPPIFVLLKLTCLVTLFDRKLQVFKNSPK